MPPKRILIVEDEAIVAMELKETLEKLGYLVMGIAFDGPDALARASETHPDLILMDIRLSGPMDGVATAERISELYDTPVIYLTAHSDNDTLRRAIKTQPYGYLIKPVKERELYSNIEMAIHKHRVRQRVDSGSEVIDSTLTMISDGVVTTDTGGRVLRMNPAAEEMCGYRREEVAGKNFLSFLHARAAEKGDIAEKILANAETTGSILYYPDPLILRTKSGEDLHISLNVGLISGEKSGHVEEMILVLKPSSWGSGVTETAEQRPSSSGLYSMSVLNALSDPILVVDQDLHLVLHNRQFSGFCKNSGLKEPHYHMPVHRIIPSRLLGSSDLFSELFDSGETHTSEKRITAGGETRVYRISYLPLSTTGSVGHIAVLFTDITERKEEQLKNEKMSRDFGLHLDNIRSLSALCAEINEPARAIAELAAAGDTAEMKQILAYAEEVQALLSRIDFKWIMYEGYRH